MSERRRRTQAGERENGAMTDPRPLTEPREHDLKTWPAYYRGLEEGTKTFEVRYDDRDYKVGDVLSLREWSPELGYTGRAMRRRVSYVLSGDEYAGIVEDYVVMGLANV